MLKLSKVETKTMVVRLIVEGWIASEGAGVLERECIEALDQNCEVELEMAGVTFIDRRGTAMLRRLQKQKLTLVNCPPIIQETLGP